MAYMTLKEMADAYLPQTDDLVVLRLYLSQPEIMDKGVQLLSSLLQREIKDLIRYKKKQITEGLYDFSYLEEELGDKEKTERTMLLIRKVIAEIPLTEIDFQWAKENLSGVSVERFYMPLQKILKEHDINIYVSSKNKEEDENDS